ncbi:MAG: long-chain fatty acid--CoA ligase [Rhodospirillaceae bacterium]|nr:MAG: long-chain fatty acid--CoA ligase [Rhodospirillaceae bacterium]
MALSDARQLFDADFPPTLPALIQHAARTHATREYLAGPERRLTFAETERESARLARGLLAMGLGKGARVGLLMPNGPDWVTSFFAISRIGALTVTLSTFFQSSEISWGIRHNDIDTLLISAKYLNADYLERLERAIPGLADQRTPELAFASHPFLRRIIVWGECDRPWALKGPASLHAAADARPQFDDTLLAATEANVVAADWLVTICTSGTTAEPKAVVHSHGGALRAVRMFTHFFNHRPDDRLYTGQAFFWVGGLNVNIIPALFIGNCLCFARTPDVADIVDTIVRERVTMLSLWAAQGIGIAEHAAKVGADLSLIRRGLGQQCDEWGQLIPRDRQTIAMGMTETFGMHSMERYYVAAPAGKAGNWGRCVPGMERRVVDPETREDVAVGQAGELYVRGQALMIGYYKREREETFTREGYFATGDLVSIDEDGYIYFHGRRTEMIKTSGANVSPREVEASMSKLEGVREAIVFGVPDPIRGEVVVAVAVPMEGWALEEATLREALKKEISSYKVPKHIFFMGFDEIPRTGSQKVRKGDLRNLLEPRIAAGGAADRT